MSGTIMTVGHSTHSIDNFIDLLQRHGVTAVADVRSAPFSRYNSQFNRAPLRDALKAAGIAYVFLGKELGARSENPDHYDSGQVVYSRLARSEAFIKGIDRLLAGAQTQQIALMCAERDPITCHRTILVARELVRRGVEIAHILADGTIEPHEDAIERMMRELRIDPDDLFAAPNELRDQAYREQERRIAYAFPSEAEAAE